MSWRDPSAIEEVIQGDEIGHGSKPGRAHLSVLWVGCILVISGQCIYGPWISWQPPRCDAPFDQPGRDVHGRYRYRIGPTCRRAFAAPAGDVVVEAVPAQPIIDLAVGRNALRSRDGRVNNQGAMLARLPEWLNLNGRGAER